MGFELSKKVKVMEGVGTTGTSAALNGPIMDFSGFEGALGLGFFSASGASGYIKFQSGTATGGVSDTTGFVLAAFKTVGLEIFRPAKQFGRFVLRGVTTTNAYNTLQTIMYGPRSEPTTWDTSTTGKIMYTPADGNATA